MWVRYVDQYGKEHRENVGAKSTAGDTTAKTEIRLGQFDPEDVRGKNPRPVMVAEIIDDKMEVARGRLKGYKADVPRFEFWKVFLPIVRSVQSQ